MAGPSPLFLLGDIGGTNARFALARAGEPLPVPTILKTEDFPTLDAALTAFLAAAGAPKLTAAAVCVAGPVTDGRVALTNCPWSVTVEALARATGVADPMLVNDFTAASMGVLRLDESERTRIGPPVRGIAGEPIAVLGPGTGLGVSGLVPDGRGGFIPLAGEGGHVDLPATTPREFAIVSRMLGGHVHVSAERAVSGPGLEKLYRVLADIDGVAVPAPPSAAEIAARVQSDARAAEAVALFTGWLGAVAGNLVLTLGARAGVYLAGGVLPRWGALFDAALFRRRFEAKGRFAVYMQEVPSFLVTAPDLALRGLRTLLAQRL